MQKIPELEKEAAGDGPTVRVAWVFREYSDDRGIDHDELFDNREAAVKASRDYWDTLTEKERSQYEGGGIYTVGLYMVEWDGRTGEWYADGEEIVTC